MTHDEKVAYFIRDMVSRGHKETKVAPPLLKFLWSKGLTVRPPQFATFGPLMLATGVPFALLWGLIMWFLIWEPQGKPLPLVAGAILTAGLFFGAATAWLVRRSAKKLALPAWEDYPAEGS